MQDKDEVEQEWRAKVLEQKEHERKGKEEAETAKWLA